MIIRLKRQDRAVAGELDDLPNFSDKNTRTDLSQEDIEKIKHIAYQLVNRTNGTINLVMELEVRYKLGLTV